MDISETWKKLDNEKLGKPIEGDFIKDQSNHPVSKLKKNYAIKTIMMSGFVLIFSFAFFYYDHPLIRIGFGILTAGYVIFLCASYFMFRKIQEEVTIDGTVLDVLTKTKEQVTKALRYETISALMISPFAGVAGYLAGYTTSGKSIDRIFSDPGQLGILAVTVIVFTIGGYFLGQRLNREGYGKSLDQISKMIEQLKS